MELLAGKLGALLFSVLAHLGGLVWEEGRSRDVLNIALFFTVNSRNSGSLLGAEQNCQHAPLLPTWGFHGLTQGKEGLSSAGVIIPISGMGIGTPTL